jgi:hypothetical protein
MIALYIFGYFSLNYFILKPFMERVSNQDMHEGMSTATIVIGPMVFILWLLLMLSIKIRGK